VFVVAGALERGEQLEQGGGRHRRGFLAVPRHLSRARGMGPSRKAAGP
jgi:hypothetical protein